MPVPHRPIAIAAVLSGLALPAAAEITAAEVWADWQRLVESYGPSLTVGDEERTAAGLTLTDVTLEYDDPDDTLRVLATIPEIAFADRSDGTVAITVSPEYPVAVAGTDVDTGEPFSFQLVARQPGLVTIASRDGDTTRYSYSGPEVSASVDTLLVDGVQTDFGLALALAGLDGSYEVTEGTPRRFVGRNDVNQVSLTAAGVDPDEPGSTFAMTVELSDVTSEGTGTVTDLGGMEGMSSMLAAGFDTGWTVSHGAAEYSLSGADDAQRFGLDTTSDSGSLTASFGPEELVYEGTNTGLEMAISSSDMPMPEVSFSMSETVGRLAIPTVPSDEPSDFGLLLRLFELELDEAIWSMFDPEGQLPRDAATLVIDIAGQARWLVDVFDPEVAEEMEPGVAPGEIDSLTVETLELSLAGAELTGDGSFEFDNSGSGPFAPAPSPSGTLNLRLEGGNTLLDALVSMGLLPEEQAMGARMMLGLFARPGTGEDTLVSTIEVGTDGSISANGQRIR